MMLKHIGACIDALQQINAPETDMDVTIYVNPDEIIIFDNDGETHMSVNEHGQVTIDGDTRW